MTLEELYRLLKGSHVQAQGIVDTLQQPLVVLDREQTVVNANPAFYRSFATDRDQTLGQSLFELGDGQWDIAELRKLLNDVVPKATAIFGYEVSHDFPGTGPRTISVTARTLVHPDDNSTQMLVVFDDVTERKKSDTANEILLAETRHRMKNLMAVIRSTANNTKAEGKTGEQYRADFLGRLEAILTAQAIIAEETEAELRSLVQKVVEPIAHDRCDIEGGPDVRLRTHQVAPLSMMLHELATNALKYGALSNTTGRVHIDWTTEQRAGQSLLLMTWREAGGPEVTPPSSTGFGTGLIAYTAQAEGGEAELDFDPSGLRASIIIPV